MFASDFLDIPALQSVNGCITLPGSKSISNRVLLLAALCDGSTTLHDVLDSDDTRVMLDALRTLGCTIAQNGNVVVINGMGGRPALLQASLFMGNAGTAIRPLTAALALIGGDYELRGVPRMHERPIGDLVDALRQLGCQIDYTGADGYPPLRIRPPSHLELDTPIRVRGDVSSQFLTALLMALPLVSRRDIVIEVVGTLISRPYIQITLHLLARFGVHVQCDDWQRFTIPAGSRLQSPGEIYVEADASSASYFIAAGVVASVASRPAQARAGPDTLKICGVGADSIQGDIRFVDAARRMGAQITTGPNWLQVSSGTCPLQAIDLDCNHIPDAAMTLAVMALYANGTTTLRNIASWRVKETDRIDAMASELCKLGATVTTGPDFIRITPPAMVSGWRTGSIGTYDDHRMAMCFALAAFNPAGLPVRILAPRCVAKTFPDYFESLFAVTQARPDAIPVICVDGPTASGKGTLARALARRLGYHVLDSGALYRVTALAARQAGLCHDMSDVSDALDAAAIVRLIPSLDMVFDDQSDTVLLDGQDVTQAIRHESIGILTSQISALPQVRLALMDRQRNCCQLPGLVADGRDMGTVVFPDAPLKIFLTASVEARANRRFNQLISKGISPPDSTTLDRVCDCLKARDLQDSSRSVAPLGPAPDAVLLDNSDLSIDQSIDQVLRIWQSKQPF